MQLSFKKLLPWGLVLILSLVIILMYCGRKNEAETESTLETKTKVEESLVDSFLVEKEIIKVSRDSALQEIDNLGTEELKQTLLKNIYWYETDSIFGNPVFPH